MFYLRSKNSIDSLEGEEKILASLLIPNIYYTIPEIQMCVRHFNTNLDNIVQLIKLLTEKEILIEIILPDEYCDFRKQVMIRSDMLSEEEKETVNSDIKNILSRGLL